MPTNLVLLTDRLFRTAFHYDNVSDDVDEYVEITGPAGIDISGYGLVLYNGNDEKEYSTILVPSSTVLADQSGGLGTFVFALPLNGIQNGDPDGVVIVDDSGAILHAFAYGGSFTPIDGPASGVLLPDIGVKEDAAGPVDSALVNPAYSYDTRNSLTWTVGTQSGVRGVPNNAPPPPGPPPPPSPPPPTPHTNPLPPPARDRA